MEERKSHCHHMTVVNTVGSSGNSSSRDSVRCGEGALKFITAMKTNFAPQMLLQMQLCAINADDILHILFCFSGRSLISSLMRSSNVNHVFANGFSLLDDDFSGPNDFSQNFPLQGGAVRQRVEFQDCK